MHYYQGTIVADKYPCEYQTQASSWATATNRIVKMWQKSKGKGSRTDKISLTIVKGFKVSMPKDPLE